MNHFSVSSQSTGGPMASCAQYSVDSDTPSGSLLPLFPVFEKGGQILQADTPAVVLMPSSFYSVSYQFIASPGSWKYFRILPCINETAALLYASFAPANSDGIASASACFITDQALKLPAFLSFRVSYPETSKPFSITGSVSIASCGSFM
ncbi:hypothetical protein [Anaerostipes sp.]|uniref:hypothetical protein n=1 Tax=Anaerostipes sp. TaxID=1872530 RepID=UPI0025BAC8DC|nr:hypothetical protein [Anaerostipes sp.]MBS7007732.1 hypothetical protein [Anaerostipes sp.]